MIHYSCDRCKRLIDPEREVRHEVRIEVQMVLDPAAEGELDADRDYLDEIDQSLMALDLDEDTCLSDLLPRKLRYDLCSECYRKFIQDPLGADVSLHVGFSQN